MVGAGQTLDEVSKAFVGRVAFLGYAGMLVGLQPIDDQESFVVPEAFQNFIGFHLGQIHARTGSVACLRYLLAESIKQFVVEILDTPAAPEFACKVKARIGTFPPSRPV